MKYTSMTILFSCFALTACNEATIQSESTNSHRHTTSVSLKTSVDNCSTRNDVPNCHFDNGIYILKLGATVTDEQQQRVVTQITDFIDNSHDDVRVLLNNKRLVIGLIEDEPDPSNLSSIDDFILALADSRNEVNGMAKVIDGIELVYTHLEDKDSNNNTIYIDESTKLAAYQKLIQLFDYYVDENNNSSAGAALKIAYNEFLQILDSQSKQGISEYLIYNQCNYGNGQLPKNTCSIDPDDDPYGTGNRDPIHILDSNLNMGAIIGMTHDYMKDPTKNSVGELEGANGTDFENSGSIGTGNAESINWSNPAFKPLADYINTWFLANTN
ncbi:hypothetical protein L4C54_08360 [Vibrio lamellibrachiae]|uniref:hypothetical protein n=1 Tax=Vibrio lamellibrachiae TaxID=2910253 RepID=UPI003D0C4596